MFFSVASPDWKPGQPLAPSGALLFRTWAEAESFAPDASVVAVSVCYNASTRAVSARGLGASSVGRWSSRAVSNSLGGITVFGPIPAALVGSAAHVVEAAGNEADLNLNDFHGWDSLTMALLA